MSCDTCNPGGRHATGGFTTESDFVHEQSRVQELIASGNVTVLKKTNGWETDFVCVACGQHWHLSTPDHAYRGFLKQIPQTSLRIAELKEKHGNGSDPL